MAIQDSNAERRNLTLLSMSIIVYYAAEGEFDGGIKLPLVNLHFENNIMLAYFLWGILVWFLLRYWMVNKGSWQSDHRHELISAIPYRMVKAYLKFKFSKMIASNDNFSGSIKYQIVEGAGKKLGFRIQQATGSFPLSNQKEPKGILDNLYLAILSLYLFFTKPTLSGYFVPYMLFLIAVFMGGNDWLQSR